MESLKSPIQIEFQFQFKTQCDTESLTETKAWKQLGIICSVVQTVPGVDVSNENNALEVNSKYK